MREYIVKFDTDEPPSEFPYGTNVRALMKITGDCDEVIRCKDCKYNNGGRCGWHGGAGYKWVVDDDDFCSCGERRTE